MYKFIDVPRNIADFAEDIARSGVETVIRYYNHRNSSSLPTKRLEASEAEALHAAGLSLAVVFQQRGGANGHIEDLDEESGRVDAQRALELARGLGQPRKSAIYFAVDHDYFRASEIDRIIPYFEAIRNTFGDEFRIGVYGSGTVGRAMRTRKLADLIWLAGATGWSGTRDVLRTDEWAIFQKALHKTWPGGDFGYDGNLLNPAHSEFGQFRFGEHNPGVPDPTRNVLMEVVARSGLKLRRGPGTQYSDIVSLPMGSLVSASDRAGDWLRVDIEGDGVFDGFMFEKFLEPVSGGFPASGEHSQPIDVARAELALGVSEIAGAANNPRIVMYHATTDGGASADETPWCSSFVNYCVEQTGRAGSNSKWAMSWHDSDWGSDVTQSPQAGDIAVFKRRSGSTNGDVIGGHVGFWLDNSNGKVEVLGGNQGNAISIRRYPANGIVGTTHYQLLSIRRP